MKNIFIAIAIIASLSACTATRTNIAVNPNDTESKFCNLGCAFHGIGNGTVGAVGSASTGAQHGASVTSGGMHGSAVGGRGTSGNGASSGAARR